MSPRAVVVGSVLVSVVALLALLALTIEPTRERPVATNASASALPTSPPSPPPLAPPQGPASVKASAAHVPSTIGAPAPSPSTSDWAYDDDGVWKTIKPGDKIAGDLFDDPEAPPRARKLRSIGSITVGVMNEANVLDEHALAAALVKVGAELDALDRDSKVAPSKRTEQHWAILEKHRAALQPHVHGAVVLRGQGYVLTFDPAPPDAGP